MSRIAFVNGKYISHATAYVHVEDRGYQFADGVYEVSAVWKGKIIDEDLHFQRLKRSLQELSISMPMPINALKIISREIILRNRITDGILYLQISRGVAPREHEFPKQSDQSVVMTARPIDWPEDLKITGEEVITVDDIRWKRRDIKSISLLPNILAKQKAAAVNAYESWLIDEEGLITEGSSSNAWIVDDQNRIITRDLSENILGGVTRLTLIRLASENGLEVIERPFSISEAKNASEAFLTSTTSFIKGVRSIDGKTIRNGAVGPITAKLHKLYIQHCQTFETN